MTWRWLTCSSALAALLVPMAAATISGRVELQESRDPAARKRDYSGVVVWLDPVDRSAIPRVAPRTARMIQKDKKFIPHILAIPVGATVDFPNFDPIFHNAFSNYNGQVFDVGLYAPGSTQSVRFTRPGVVRVFCNIHANMSAVIVVAPTPWFATTNGAGGFEIANVPPGEYTLNVFHERATPSNLEKLKRRIVVDEGAQGLAAITISEGGYLAIPHKNKYGKEYPAAADDGGVYPATRK